MRGKTTGSHVSTATVTRLTVTVNLLARLQCHCMAKTYRNSAGAAVWILAQCKKINSVNGRKKGGLTILTNRIRGKKNKH